MHNVHRITNPVVVGMLAAMAMSLSGLARAHSAHEKPGDWVFSLGAGVLQYLRHWDETQSLFSTGIRRSGRIRAMGRSLIVSTGIRLRAGDQPTLNTLVGVTSEQSVVSGLATYRPDGGLIALGINSTVILPLSESLSVLSTLSVERLDDELSDSSLVSTRGDPVQASVGVFLNYRLGAQRRP